MAYFYHCWLNETVIVLSVTIYRLKFKAGHQTYLLSVNCRVVGMFPCWAWLSLAYSDWKGGSSCVLKETWAERTLPLREQGERCCLLGIWERRKSQSSVFRYLVSSKEILSLETVGCWVAVEPGAGSVIIPGVGMKSLPLCLAMGLRPFPCTGAGVALSCLCHSGQESGVAVAVVNAIQRPAPITPNCCTSTLEWTTWDF